MNREPPLPPSTKDKRHKRRRNLNILNIVLKKVGKNDEVWLERFELERLLLSLCVCLRAASAV